MKKVKKIKLKNNKYNNQEKVPKILSDNDYINECKKYNE